MNQNKKIDDIRFTELKKWMTLEQAIEYLSSFCTIEIEIRDLLDRALEGSLTLSIYLKKGTRARPCIIINKDEIFKDEFDCVNADKTLKGYLWKSEDKFIKPEDTEFMLEREGCHDLIMAGGVLYEFNNMVTQSCGLAAPKAILGNQTEIFLGSPGVIVKNKNGQVYELMSVSLFSYEKIDGEPHKMQLNFHGAKEYHPMMCLPLHESPLVLRTNELLKLEKLLAVQESGNAEQDDNNHGDQSKPEMGNTESFFAPGEKRLRSFREIAEFLGVSPGTVRNNYINLKGFPFIKQGGIYFSSPSRLEKWQASYKPVKKK